MAFWKSWESVAFSREHDNILFKLINKNRTLQFFFLRTLMHWIILHIYFATVFILGIGPDVILTVISEQLQI